MPRARLPLLLIPWLAACGPVGEREPNDDYSRAVPVQAGRSAQGTLGGPADVDWYRIQAKRDGILSVRLSGIRDVDWVLGLRGADRGELKRLDDTAVGGDEQALGVWLPQGELYVVVSNKNAKFDKPGQPYALDLDFEAPAGREREPNDRASAATPLEPGSPMSGHYHPAANLLAEDGAEEDWFKLAVARPGLQLLDIDVSEAPRIDAVLELYDANGYKVREADAAGPGEPESLRNFGVRGPAEFRLRLRSKARAANASVPYHLVTELTPYQGEVEFEPNDQRLEATPLEGDRIGGTIAPAGDSDWYRIAFPTDTQRLLRADLSAPAGLDLQLAVMDDAGNALLAVDNMGREQPEVLTGIAVRSELYLVVSERSGKRADVKAAYTLTRQVSDWQEGLEYELNDGSRTAQAIKTGGSVDGYFAPKGDVDWYEFNVYQKGAAALELAGVLNVRAALALYDQEYRPLDSVEAKKPGESVALERELEPGTYSVRLGPIEPGQSNVRDKYTFRVRMR